MHRKCVFLSAPHRVGTCSSSGGGGGWSLYAFGGRREGGGDTSTTNAASNTLQHHITPHRPLLIFILFFRSSHPPLPIHPIIACASSTDRAEDGRDVPRDAARVGGQLELPAAGHHPHREGETNLLCHPSPTLPPIIILEFILEKGTDLEPNFVVFEMFFCDTTHTHTRVLTSCSISPSNHRNIAGWEGEPARARVHPRKQDPVPGDPRHAEERADVQADRPARRRRAGRRRARRRGRARRGRARRPRRRQGRGEGRPRAVSRQKGERKRSPSTLKTITETIRHINATLRRGLGYRRWGIP
jgi:hypothetical protein